MKLEELERQLQEAEARLEAVAQTISPFTDSGRAEFKQASSAVTQIEREIAQLKDEPYARPLDFPVMWDVGAPLPHLLQSDINCFLLFYLNSAEQPPDSLPVKPIEMDDDSVERRELIAVVQFHYCVTTRMGDPNDEVFHGHLLYGRGGEPYSAQIIENTPWIGEFERINSVHSQYKPEYWRKLHHYIFWFHDSTFECIARSFEVEVYHAQLSQLLPLICQRL